jgi:TPR repeat protein
MAWSLLGTSVLLLQGAAIASAQQEEGPILKPKPRAAATLLVMCDLACNWKLDGEAKGLIDAGGSAKARVEIGQHEVVGATEDGLDKVKSDVEIKAAGQTIFHIALQPVRDARVKAEQDADPKYLQDHAVERANEGQALYDQQRYQEAKPILEKACNGGETAACVTLGAIYDPAGGADSFNSDLSLARSLFQKGCDSGEMLGCTRLGMIYEFGRDNDLNKACSLYQKACDGGDMWGCNNLAGSYESGRGEPKDHSRALALYQKACKGGFEWACHNLSKLQYPDQ